MRMPLFQTAGSMLCLPEYLDGIAGVYQTPKCYYVEEFDKNFSPKEKLKPPGQLFE